MVVIIIENALFLTSQCDVTFTFANQRFGEACWHNMHIIPHALSLLLVQCIIVISIISVPS